MNTAKNTLGFCLFLATILLVAFCAAGCAAPAKPALSSTQAEETAQSAASVEANTENTAPVYEWQKQDGTTVYSIDGGSTWINQEEFEKEYPSQNIEWWTYEEYAGYIEREKIVLQEMVDNQATGYTDSRGYFVWTQELADETIEKYEKDLEAIKNGVKISKSIDALEEDFVYESYSLNPKSTPDVIFEFSMPDGTTKQFSGKDKTDIYELVKNFCNQQIELGELTQEDMDKILSALE